MSIQFSERAGAVVVEVVESFHPDDANLIETAVSRLPTGERVEVDLCQAREKHLLALWLLAQAARREPGRYRITGLTMADTRFLALLGLDEPEARVH